MADITWFAKIDGAEAGPYTPAELKALVDQGQIESETLVRQNLMKGYVPAKQIKGLLPGLSPSSPIASPRGRPAPRKPPSVIPPKVLMPVVIGAIGFILLLALIIGIFSGGKKKSTTPTNSDSDPDISTVHFDIPQPDGSTDWLEIQETGSVEHPKFLIRSSQNTWHPPYDKNDADAGPSHEHISFSNDGLAYEYFMSIRLQPGTEDATMTTTLKINITSGASEYYIVAKGVKSDPKNNVHITGNAIISSGSRLLAA